MRVAVATCVHHPLDARIYSRQIEALLRAGHEVAYAAPFTSTQTPFDDRLECHDVPRAVGLRRRDAVGMTAAWLRAVASDVDVILVHDIELSRALTRITTPAVRVWDVHEDNPEAISSRAYVPALVRPLARTIARHWEARAEKSLRLLLAETSYRGRFAATHPVVLNLPWVDAELRPLPADQLQPRVTYVGSLTAARGVEQLALLAQLLQADGIAVHAIGSADDDRARNLLEAPPANLVWHGRLPNPQALAFVRESIAGLSLLEDTPNFSGSMPTKVLEYLAQGTPVVTTPLPLAAHVVRSCDAGVVVPFANPEAAATAIREIAGSPQRRHAMAERGHRCVQADYNWATASQDFVDVLEQWHKAASR